MEYLAQILTKSLLESSNDEILNWYDDNQAFISKRNELILGPWRMLITKGEDIIALLGNNENRYGKIVADNIFLNIPFANILAAAVTEFSPEQKDKQQQQQLTGKKKQAALTKKILRAKPSKYHFLIPTKTSDVQRKELEQRQRPVSITNHFLIYALKLNLNHLSYLLTRGFRR